MSHGSKKRREILFGQVKGKGSLKVEPGARESPMRGTKQENSDLPTESL